MTDDATSTPTSTPDLTLHAAPRGGRARLVPEEAAAFDVTLRNDGPAPRSVLALDGNPSTPVVRVRDAAGAVLVEANAAEMEHRMLGETGDPVAQPPRTLDLAPGEEHATWLNVWNFADPLPPGRYDFEVEHHVSPLLRSDAVPFEIVEARVPAGVLGYVSSARSASALAWAAAPAGEPLHLFVRVSAFADHGAAQGTSRHGELPDDVRLSLGLFVGGIGSFKGWVAATSGDHVELHHHAMGAPTSSSGPIALPVTGAAPVPRFPDRGHAIFLATGVRDGAPALAGVAWAEGAPPPSPWAVPLARPASASACAFGMEGEITVLYVSDDGKEARVSRIAVDEAGAVTAPEELVRTTPNRVLAIAADVRAGVTPTFAVLEADRAAHDRVTLYKVPLTGAALDVPPLARLAGWPAGVVAGAPQPLPAREAAIEIGLRGGTLLAIVDDRGRLFGGPVARGLALLRDTGACHAAHVASMRGHDTYACFTEQGVLFHAGGR